MFRGDPHIIREYTDFWCKHNKARYYLELRGSEYIGCNLQDVSAYFDTDGIFHVFGGNPILRAKIEQVEEERYYKHVRSMMRHVKKWWKFLESFATMNGNTIIIEYKEYTFKINHDLFSKICTRASVGMFNNQCYIMGCPDCLDKIIESILLYLDRTDPAEIEFEENPYCPSCVYYDDPLFPIDRDPIYGEEPPYSFMPREYW